MESKTLKPDELDSGELGASEALSERVNEEIEFLENKGRELRIVRARVDDNGEVNQVTIQADDEMYRLSEVAPGNVSRTVFRDPAPDGESTDTPYFVEEEEDEEGDESEESEASGEEDGTEKEEEDEEGEEAEENEEEDGDEETEGDEGDQGEGETETEAEPPSGEDPEDVETRIRVPPLPAIGYAGMLAVAFFMTGFVTYAFFTGMTDPTVDVARWSYRGGRLPIVAGWLAAFTIAGAGIGFFIGRK